MKRIIMMLLVLAVVGGTTEVNAQNWLKKLGKTVENAAKRKIEQKAEEKTEKVVDYVFEGNIGKGNKNKKDKNNNAANNGNEVYDDGTVAATAQSGGTQQKQSPEMAYAKSDFVAGDEIIFDDNFDNEQLGEFPSQWDLIEGVAEVVSVGGKKAMLISERFTKVCPLMKTPHNYFGDVFTVEYDVMFSDGKYGPVFLMTEFNQANEKKPDWVMDFEFPVEDDRHDVGWKWKNSSGKSEGTFDFEMHRNEWYHVAVSFNKRAYKVYINGTRIINVPNVITPPGWMHLEVSNGNKNIYITNFRIAKGAVPLYDRMMSDGKFITYGITFDVGKSTIKPESMGEINRIVQLMNENPDLKFSVEGHTDSTGNAASNQTLSEARSQAIVAKLVEMGIAADRLTAVGKGQNNPIADNGTDEGRAKNRRVEFVKL